MKASCCMSTLLRSMIAKSILSVILVRCTHDLLGVANCLRAAKALGALFACTMRSSPSRGPGRNGTRQVSTCPASLLSDASIGLDAPNQIPEATFATLSLWICKLSSCHASIDSLRFVSLRSHTSAPIRSRFNGNLKYTQPASYCCIVVR
jgi:hypothetical protein